MRLLLKVATSPNRSPLTTFVALRLNLHERRVRMKIAYTALTLAVLLVPAAALADNFDRRDGRGISVRERFERDHPRWPRVYCHRHRHRLHSDDKRRHCHNWERESWRSAHGGAGGYFDHRHRYERRDFPRPRFERRTESWRGYEYRDHRRPRYERRDDLRSRLERRREVWRRHERRHEAWRRDRFDANQHRRGGRSWDRFSDRGSNPRGSTDRSNDRRSR